MSVGLQGLAEAIVFRALQDITGTSVDCRKHKEDAIRFLKSDYCEHLTGINGQYLLRKVKDYV